MIRYFAIPLRGRMLGAIACLAISACATSSPSTLQTMTIYNDASADGYVTVGAENGLGDKILWRSEMQTEAGRAIGTGSGHCTKLDTKENFFCSFTIEVTDRGLIAAQGVQLAEPQASTFAITGGTGAFAGITGEMIARPIENRNRFVYDIAYQTPPR